MCRAFVATGLTCGRARLEHCASQIRIVPSVARQDPCGYLTEVGAIDIRANALGEVGNRVLAQAGVGAGRTTLNASLAGLDARQKVALFTPPKSLGYVSTICDAVLMSLFPSTFSKMALVAACDSPSS